MFCMVIYSFFHHIIDDFFLIDDQVPYTNTREIKKKEKDKMEGSVLVRKRRKKGR